MQRGEAEGGEGCAEEPWGKGTQMTDHRGLVGLIPHGSPRLACPMQLQHPGNSTSASPDAGNVPVTGLLTYCPHSV